MPVRFFSVIFLIWCGLAIAAEENIWDCQQNPSGEWSCVSGGQAQEQTRPAPQVSAPTEPAIATTATEAEDRDTITENFEADTPATIVERRAPIFFRPPQVIAAKREGWTCAPATEEEGTWNCSLVGADPKGEARIVATDAEQDSWIAPTYGYAEEQIFTTLQGMLPADPWMSCDRPFEPRRVFRADKELRELAPMDVHADYSEVFDKEITSFYGNVEITRADQNVTADMASYDTVSETMDAQGHVFYKEDELALYSDTVLLKLATDEARLRNALFISPSGPIRGKADAVYRDSRTLSRYHEASFTSCRPGEQDWIIHADRLKMNRQSGQGSATEAWLELGGVPVLYTPYISFPLDDRRVSGFLAPTWGSTEKNGFDFEIPFYWNIATNFDATLTPRYMTRRGGMLRSNFRYLTKISQGELDFEVLPFDLLEEKTRFSGSLQAQTAFGEGVFSQLDLNYVSDDDYFNDLNNALGFSDTRHVRSLADISLHREWLYLVARMEHYQTIDRTIPSTSLPYQKYPQVELHLNHAFADLPINLTMQNQYTYFFSDDRVNGHRINLLPSVSFPLENEGAFLIPKFSLQHTQYFLDDRSPGQAEDISRTLPVMSVDSGLFFEKELDFVGTEYLHTIEPRAFYLYIPYKDQSDIPIFDTSLYDFNINSLFRENRFNGPDRIQDANQLSAVVTSRLIDNETGQEKLRLSLGEIFYFRDRLVVLEGGTPETDSFSNFVAELGSQFTNHLSFSSALQWNHQANDIARGQVSIRYRDLPDRIINLGYRYRRDVPGQPENIEQTDVSFRWPIYANWYAVGRWQYSFLFNETTESFIGLEKESCCWRFRIVGRRFVNSISESVESEPENGLFVQVELKGLGNFGDKVDEFLEKNLNGYQRPPTK